MVNFLISILLLVIIIYVVYLVIDTLRLPSQVKNIAYLIVGLIVLVILLQWLGIYSPSWPTGPPWNHR